MYPLLSDEWQQTAELRDALATALDEARTVGFASLSVELGGMAVLAADDSAFERLREALPPLRRGAHKYPLVLPRHAAFHTPLMTPMAHAIDAAIPAFASPPRLPLADGTGRVWATGVSCDLSELRDYTVHEQVVTPYHFGKSLEAAIEATDPDVLLLLRPGASLSGAVGQTLCRMRWRGIVDKESFRAVQASPTPALVATANIGH